MGDEARPARTRGRVKFDELTPKPPWGVPDAPPEAYKKVDDILEAEENEKQPRSTVKSEIWVPKFLRALQEFGNVGWAINICGATRSTVYQRRREYKVFRRQWKKAMDMALQNLLDETYRDAMNGNALLKMFIIKRHFPEYRDNWKDPALQDGMATIQVPIAVANVMIQAGMAQAGLPRVDVDEGRPALPQPEIAECPSDEPR